MFLYKIVSHNVSRYLRNLTNIKPTLAYKPNNKKSPVSDFFFWEESKKLHTKFYLTNLASQILPELKQIDKVKIFVFNSDGKIIKELKNDLNYLETLEIDFSKLNITGFGSFFVFHIFNQYGDLVKKNSHVAERGYISYSDDKNFWKFLHGNNYAAYIDNRKNKISSIMTHTFKNYKYIPQVSFRDCEEFQIILNNPTHKSLKTSISTYTDYKEIKKNILLDKKSTSKIIFREKNINKIQISSNFLMFRPIIIKKYSNDFDIFHG